MNALNRQEKMNSIALQRCKSFAFDVNQQAESLIRWEQRYNQHSSGTFYGYLDELKLGGLHLFEEFTSRRILQQCCVNGNSFWLGFSLQPQRPKINGKEVEEGQLMFRPSDVEFELLTPQDFHIFGLVVEKSAISKELQGQDKERWLKGADNSLISRPDNYVSFELAKMISLLLEEPCFLMEGLSPNEKRRRLDRFQPLIKSRIADLLIQTETGIKETDISGPGKRRVIDKISKHVQETGYYPLTISDLCHIAHVSRRTLQYAFEQELGISPIRYIRDSRLNAIRRILIETHDPLVISDLAMEYGFYHISTFNEHYRKLFGETPTQTMLRAKSYRHILMCTR